MPPPPLTMPLPPLTVPFSDDTVDHTGWASAYTNLMNTYEYFSSYGNDQSPSISNFDSSHHLPAMPSQYESHINNGYNLCFPTSTVPSSFDVPLPPPAIPLSDVVVDVQSPFSYDFFINNSSSSINNGQSYSGNYAEFHPLNVQYLSNNIDHYLPFTAVPPPYVDPPPLYLNYPTNNISQSLRFSTVPDLPYAKPSTVNNGESSLVPCGTKLDDRVVDLSRLPPGYKFFPNDEELILDYLMKKVTNQSLPCNTIIDVDLYKYNPWNLEEKYFKQSREKKWYLFTPTTRKYPNGERPSRSAGVGYWKATGADKNIRYKDCKPYNDKVYGDIAYGDLIGTKKALVFYIGKPPKADKTNWIMHEYNLFNKDHRPNKKGTAHDMRLDPWVLCSIYHKAGKSIKGSSHSDDENESLRSDLNDSNNECTSTDQYMHDNRLPDQQV
ncbi:hypothetical protein EZV62_003942 [Acer yangbiense]|uniref:NAC domain-containing protein n=1 Tax=Acer yangbiense TaxID=1000413 RepID=A0A5C7II53_9ROSI|nr:hypothetical protein EZV62_003942 [Acer yangbiense]